MFDWMRRTAAGFNSGDSLARSEQMRLASVAGRRAKPAEMYALLRQYYFSNNLYQSLARAFYDAGIANPAIRALRNPCFSVVEFYVASVIPGPLDEALPIETDNERIIEPIQQVWQWSNFGTQKQVLIRWLAMLGDVFIKTVQTPAKDRVYHQLVDPAHVTEFDADERGFITYCRIDVPVQRRQGDLLAGRTHTEVWSQAEQTFRRWEHDKGDRPIEELGTPLEEIPLSAFGIDFVPLVMLQFRDIGEPRGVGAYTLQLDAIDELQRLVTRMHQQLFRHAGNTWVAEAADRSATGRPLPALAVAANGTTPAAATITVGDETMFSLPGGYTLTSMVPNINYAAMLDAYLAHERGIQHGLPEMAYAEIAEIATGDVSGRALRYKLTAAVARVIEVRGNVHEGVKRAAWMALTMGESAGLFRDLGGTFESGAFDLTFGSQDVIPLSDLEQYQADVQRATAAKLRKDLGVTTDQILKELDYDQATIDEMAQQREANQADLNAAMGGLLDRQPGAVVPVAPAVPARNGTQPPSATNGGR